MVAEVIIDISCSEIDKVFEYDCGGFLTLEKGMRVLVPFCNRQTVGFVMKVKEVADYAKELKCIDEVLDAFPVLLSQQFALMAFLETRYNLRKIDIIRLFIPSGFRKQQIKDKIIEYVSIFNSEFIDEQILTISKRQKNKLLAVTDVMSGDEARTVLNEKYGKKNIDELIEGGFFCVTTKIIKKKPYDFLINNDKDITLNEAQKNTVSAINNGKSGIYLLRGVTGSGKTEVYMNCIASCIAEGKNAIILAPEISLTPQLISRFRGKFGNLVAVQHSQLTERERYDEWISIKSGEIKLVVGARSAIFAPLENIGLIIIDEEHDGSYYSENNPRYNTIEVAEFIINHAKAKLILGSATPSVESYKAALDGKYTLLELPERVNKTLPPEIELVDMGAELRRGNNGIFSRELLNALKTCLDRHEQAIIFLNRRGYASFVMCKKCGYIAKCADCDISLTYHKEDNRLKCHYCGNRYALPDRCPKCGNTDIKLGRNGTEKLVIELKKLFIGARILRMDNDVAKTKNAIQNVLDDFKAQKADILVGTQMIAKGHNFENVTLVGILDTDMYLYFSDYRAQERTFQLITQVAGRAGRFEKKGRVILQTNSPRHFVFNYATNHDYVGFFKNECAIRETTKFPPFSTVVRVLIQSETEQIASDTTAEIYKKIKVDSAENKGDYIYLSAMRSPVNRIEGKFRYQILMRLIKEKEKEALERIFVCSGGYTKNVSVWVEINPQSLT